MRPIGTRESSFYIMIYKRRYTFFLNVCLLLIFFFSELIAYRPGVFIIIIIVVNGHIVHAGAFLIPKYAYTHANID